MTDNSVKRNQRMKRALNQKMFLLSANHYHNLVWSFEVEGFSGNSYILSFTQSGITCTCPHVKSRHITCKHMFFIIGRVCKLDLKLLDTKLEGVLEQLNINIFSVYPNLNEQLQDKLKTRLSEKITIINDNTDNCSICFETMKNGKLEICKECKNSFHTNCITRWMKVNNTCPLCRDKITIVINETTDIFSKLTISDL